MIQVGTYLNVVDNSGAKKACCIKVLSGFRCRYAYTGDTILVSIKSLRSKRRTSIRAKKGKIFKALIIRTKKEIKSLFVDKVQFLENAILLLNKQNKLLATRIFGVVPKFLRYTKFSRIISVAAGVL
jgi:large subunit ribosomal protein L14